MQEIKAMAAIPIHASKPGEMAGTLAIILSSFNGGSQLYKSPMQLLREALLQSSQLGFQTLAHSDF